MSIDPSLITLPTIHIKGWSKEPLGAVREAVERGDAIAQYNLGAMYGAGKGVVQNFKLAYVWLSTAAANGYPLAAKARDSIVANKQLSSAAFRDALKLAERYFEQYQSKNKMRPFRGGCTL
ncbi:MAG: hypothetical protein ACRCWB_03905 [Enterovibrio sp.]